MSSKNTTKNYKTPFIITGILLLINPVAIYLLSGGFWLSIIISTLAITITVFIIENNRINRLTTIWLNIIIVISLLLHTEIIFTYKFPDYIIEDLYTIKSNYYFNRPYLDKTFQDKEYYVHYKTNAQGFRIGKEDDPEVKIKECDWLFIGDSYTQGAQVEYEDLFTTKLFDHFPNKIIVNAGISGLGIVDEYYYYINEGKKLNPKKVFLQICNFNDFMKVEKRTSGFSDYLMHHSNFARYILYDFKYANPSELPLGRWTEPFYPDKKSNDNYNIFHKTQTEIKKKDIENFKLYLKKFIKAVKENNAELVLIQIPTKEQVSYKYLNEVLNEFNIDIDELDMEYPNKLLSSLSKENKIEHIDLLQNFIKEHQFLFFDFDEHLNELGHKEIAKYISESIKKSIINKSTINLSLLNVGDRYPIFSTESFDMFFQSWRDGNMEIFTADSIMTNFRRLTWNKIDELHPWPSPDGKQLVFTEGDQALNNTKIVVMDTSGQNRKHLINQEGMFGAIPSFNYKGDKITYAAWHIADGKYTNPYIVVQNLETGYKENITHDKFEHWRPIFSPDEKKLYYIAKENNTQFDIYSYSFELKKTSNITKSNYDEWDPCISNDGMRIVYAGQKNGNWDLFLINLENGKLTQLTDSKGDEWDPSFSPCGQYIYYAATYGLKNGIFKMTLPK